MAANTNTITADREPGPFDALLRRASIGSVTIQIDGTPQTFRVCAWTNAFDQIAAAAFPRPVLPEGATPDEDKSDEDRRAAARLATERQLAATAGALIGLPVTVTDQGRERRVGFGDSWGGRDPGQCQVEYMRLVEPVVSTTLTAAEIESVLQAGQRASGSIVMRDKAGNTSAPSSTPADQPSDQEGGEEPSSAPPAGTHRSARGGGTSSSCSESASGSGTSPSPATRSPT